jgi:hypothetical protein
MAALCCIVAEKIGEPTLYLAECGEWTENPKKAVRFYSLSSAPKHTEPPRKGYCVRVVLNENMPLNNHDKA